MRILFTRNNTVVSKLIRTVTGESVSHVAVRVGNYVIHSNFLGTRIEHINYFTAHSDIQYDIQYWDELETMPRILAALAAKRGYDFPAMAHLAIRALTPTWLRDSLPRVNIWNVSGLFICTELVTYILDGKPDSVITPYKLYKKLKET